MFGGTGAYRGLVAAMVPFYLLDSTSTVPIENPERFIVIGAKWVTSNSYTYNELCSNTDSFLSISGACSELASLVAMPLRKSGGQTFVEYLGESSPSFTISGSFYSAPPRFPNTFIPDANCLNSVMSSVVDSIVSNPRPETNIGWGFQVAATSAGTNSGSDCHCIDEDWAISPPPTTANSYVGDGQTVASESCNLSCTVASRTIEVFPKRIRLTLPSVIDLTQMRVTDCLALGNLSTSAISNAYMERHASLDDQYVLDAECSDVISDPWSGTPASPAVHIPWDLNESLTLANCEAFSARYRLGGTNLCPNEYFVKLYVGYVDSTGPSDSANTVRLFTQALVAVRFVNNGGTAQSPLYQWWSLRLGPEFDLDDYTTTEQQSYTLYDNVWNWQHDWDFQNFGLASWAFRTSNYGGTGCPSPPSPPNAWYCDFYSHNPNFWLASKAAKQGISTDMSDYDPNCTGDPYFLLWMKDMNNVLADFRIVPENSYEAASEPSCSSSEFIRYQASGA
jgi:hypothetical protein